MKTGGKKYILELMQIIYSFFCFFLRMLNDFDEQLDDADELSDGWLSVSSLGVKTLILISQSISDGGTVESLLDNDIVRSLSISDGFDITGLLHVPSQLACIAQHSQIHASVQ